MGAIASTVFIRGCDSDDMVGFVTVVASLLLLLLNADDEAMVERANR
jgi:hypothetical protein